MSSSVYDQKQIVDTTKFSQVVKKLRSFFEGKGFVEVFAQNRLSILAACEDPDNIATYNYAGQLWPLPQTSQMWLEWELLTRLSTPKEQRPAGYFSVSTSFRNEKNPVPGRHDLIFPMFEFELEGDLNSLISMECELMEYLGYGDCKNFDIREYEEIAKEYGVEELDHEHEMQLYADKGPVSFITKFPWHTSPFWNMKRVDNGEYAQKVDVILSGMETIGSAERSSNTKEMRDTFKTISDGQYAQTIYHKFTKERVDAELDDFLKLPFVARCGGGIGMTRLIRSMEMEGLLETKD